MKKILTLLLALAMSVSFVACTSANTDEESSDTSLESSQDESSEEESSEDESSEESSEEESSEDETPAGDVDFSDLYATFDTIFNSADLEADFQEFLLTGTQKGEVTADNMTYFLGTDDYEFVEAVACEPMMSSQAMSYVLVRANSNEEALAIAQRLPTTVDPIKWVCVEVAVEDVQTAVIGDVVLLVMSENSEKFIEAFNALAE